jgi:CRISPR/Cas system-associated exonuclease Cas4 (RecB family)
MLVTCSSMSSYSRCPRQFYWGYVRAVKPAVYSAPIRLGNAIHHVLEVLYSTLEPASTRACAANYLELRPREWWKELVWQYTRHYAVELTPNADRLVEDEFRFPLGEGITYGGRIDLWQDGTLTDHKTTWRTTQQRWARNRSWEQLYAYAMALTAQGRTVETLVFNVLQADARSDTRFFRIERPLDHRELDVMPRRILTCARRVLAATDYPAREGGNCQACIFGPLCEWSLEPDISDEALLAAWFVPKDRPHEELSN